MLILDPSNTFRPEKEEDTFRNFTSNGDYYDRVKKTYDLMHTKQTYEYAKARVSMTHSMHTKMAHEYAKARINMTHLMHTKHS